MTYGYPIYSKQLTSDAGVIIATNIPQNYTDLFVVIHAKSAHNGTDWLSLNLNGQTEGNKQNYSRSGFYTGFGLAASADAIRMWGEQYANSNTSNFSQYEFTPFLFSVPNYSNTNMTKQVMMLGGRIGLVSADSFISQLAGMWNSTDAITQMHFTADAAKGFKAGTTIDIYGTKRTGQ